MYSRTSIKSAKRDAARQRAADGGQFDWWNESLRKHGALQRPEGPNLMAALFPSTQRRGNHNNTTAADLKARKEALRAAKCKRRGPKSDDD